VESDVRWQQNIAPAAREESDAKLQSKVSSNAMINKHQTILTPNIATLLITLAFSGEVKDSYVLATKPFGAAARRPTARST